MIVFAPQNFRAGETRFTVGKRKPRQPLKAIDGVERKDVWLSRVFALEMKDGTRLIISHFAFVLARVEREFGRLADVVRF